MRTFAGISPGQPAGQWEASKAARWGRGVGCRELLSLLKWQALPARKGQLGRNRNGVEKNKQEVLLKFQQSARVHARAEQDLSRPGSGLAGAITWGIHSCSSPISECCSPQAAKKECPDVRRKAEGALGTAILLGARPKSFTPPARPSSALRNFFLVNWLKGRPQWFTPLPKNHAVSSCRDVWSEN